MSLNEEQKRRMAENKAKALARRRDREKEKLEIGPGPKSAFPSRTPVQVNGPLEVKKISSAIFKANIDHRMRRRMEENRAKALAERQEKEKLEIDVGPKPAIPSGPLVQVHRPLEVKKIGTTFKANTDRTWTKQSDYQNQEKRIAQSYSKPKMATEPFSTRSPVTFSAGLRGVDVLCVLDSPVRFRVEFPFNEYVMSVCKSMKSSSYDYSSCTWSFDLKEHWTLIRRLRVRNIKIVPLPDWILATFRGKLPTRFPALKHNSMGCSGCNVVASEASAPTVPETGGSAAPPPPPPPSAEGESIDLFPSLHSVDEKLVNALMPFQRKGIEFGIRNQGRVLMADDMGLGKTIQAIGIACYYRRDWPLLVLCPSSLRMVWSDALCQWLPSLKCEEVCVAYNTETDLSSGLVAIVSYDIAVRLEETLKARKFQVVIADECHFLKNYKSLRSKVCLPLLKSSKRAVLLSGTPALSRPSELYTQISAIAPKLFPSFTEFGVRYCDGCQNEFGWDFSGASNLEELQLLLEQKLMIRRLKTEVLNKLKLPDKFRKVVKLDPSLVKATGYGLKQTEKDFQRAMELETSEKHEALLQFFKQTAKVKCAAVLDYVSNLIERGVKVLLFAHHRIMMDALCKELDSKEHQYIRIDGSTVGKDRLPLCKEFQSNPDVVAAVLSVTAANAGLHLTAACAVVFTELYWNPGMLIQAEDRVYRIGQENSVTIHYLIASGTADDYMWRILRNKLRVLDGAGLSNDDFDQPDYEVHEQEPIMQCSRELVSTAAAEQSIPQTSSTSTLDDADCDMYIYDDHDGVWKAAEPCEPQTKRPRLQ